MLPTLNEGDLVVARRVSAHAATRLQPGVIVCVQHPTLGFMIKRLIGYTDTNGVVLDSDGQTGADSADLGDVPATAITHRLWFRIPRGNS